MRKKKRMQVLLLEDCKALGATGALVGVKSGYARNYLFPQKKAILATEEAKKAFEHEKIKQQYKLAYNIEQATLAAEEVQEQSTGVIIMSAKAGEGGKIFGSIKENDIAETIQTQTSVKIKKHSVTILNKSIRVLGDHPVKVKFHEGVECELIVRVVARDKK